MLKDRLNDILLHYDMNIMDKGRDILRKLASGERMINYNNLFFKTGNPIIDNYDFLKRLGTLYDLLIDLLNEKIGIIKAEKEQNEMTKKINELGNFVLSEEKSINKEKSKGAIKKAKTKTQRKEIISLQKSVMNNAIKLHDKRSVIINAFINRDIYLEDVEEDVYHWDKEPEFEESIAERANMRRQNQEGQGLRILTPEQMLSRLLYRFVQLN